MPDVIATLTRWPADLAEIPAGVSHLEVRADLAGDVDVDRLRRSFPGTLVYVLRSRRHGGRCADPPRVRRRRLAAAARRYDVVDLEADHDLDRQLLAAIPPQRRRISWHGPSEPLGELRDRFDAMAAVPAARYLLAPAAASAARALTPLRLLAQLSRRDVTAYGTGPAGTWSRLLAPWLGAPSVAGNLSTVDDDGVPPVAALCTDYLFPALPPVRELYGLIGPVARTSSFPRLQNLAYRGREVPGLFLPFYLKGLGDFFTGFWPDVPVGLHELGLPLRGLSVSGPLKEAALRVADVASPAARAAGGANALIRRGGRWWAETTDTSAVAAVLQRAGVPLAHRPAAVVGCGGAGRAAAVALKAAGAAVTMVNRNEARGRLAADLLGLPFVPLRSFTGADCALLVHATPIRDELPFPLRALDALAGGATVFDMVSVPGETALVAAARGRGLHTIDGRVLAGVEAIQQFHLMTGRTMPVRLAAGLAPATTIAAPLRPAEAGMKVHVDGVRGASHAPVRPGRP